MSNPEFAYTIKCGQVWITVQSIRISLFQEFKSHYTDKFLILLLKKRKFLRICATNSVYDSGDWCKHDHDRVYGSRERRVNTC